MDNPTSSLHTIVNNKNELKIDIMDGDDQFGAANQNTGQMVKAFVKLNDSENIRDFRKRMRQSCKDSLPKFKIPQMVILVEGDVHNDRFKKLRQQINPQENSG